MKGRLKAVLQAGGLQLATTRMGDLQGRPLEDGTEPEVLSAVVPVRSLSVQLRRQAYVKGSPAVKCNGALLSFRMDSGNCKAKFDVEGLQRKRCTGAPVFSAFRSAALLTPSTRLPGIAAFHGSVPAADFLSAGQVPGSASPRP